MTFLRFLTGLGIKREHILKLSGKNTPVKYRDLKLYLKMIYKITKRIEYSQWLSSLDFFDFFKVIGIEPIGKIYSDCNFRNFREYLRDNYHENWDCDDYDVLYNLGFTHNSTKLYLETLNNYIEQDSVVNWIYMIIETLFYKDTLQSFSKRQFNIDLFNSV